MSEVIGANHFLQIVHVHEMEKLTKLFSGTRNGNFVIKT